MEQLNRNLKKYWGFDALRPLQQQAVQAILQKNDTVVLLPTGGGKSVCYQLPAITLPGIAIVVSPLISLMQDQVAQLQQKKIKAMHLAGTLPPKELDRLLSNAAFGDYKLLYISPERLQTTWVLERLKDMPISLIAVDEAHCISQWGYDFRPSYLNVKVLRQLLPDVPIMALTATATSQVLSDISKELLLRDAITVRDTFFRTNLAIRTIHTERKEARCVAVLQKSKGAAIVYLRSRNGTMGLAKFLCQQGISAQHYHAGMDAEERAKAQQSWMTGQTRVMVATTAFGMGIDKPDVRLVIHLDIPDSPESYYQEIGRAGRDGKKSFCFLFYNSADELKLENSYKDEPDIQKIQQIYNAFYSENRIAIGAGKFVECPIHLYSFSAKYNFSSRHVHQAFVLLDRMGFVSYQDVTNRPSSIRFVWNEKDLYNFQIQNPTLEPVTKALLRLYGGITDYRTNISEERISRKTKLPIHKVIKHIDVLAKRGVLRYKKRYKGVTITLLTERLPGANLRVSPELLKLRISNKKKRAEAMLSMLANADTCKMAQLVAYFNEPTEQTCGMCDVCTKNAPLKLIEKIGAAAADGGIALQSLVEEFPHIASHQIKKAVEELIDTGAVSVLENGKLHTTNHNG